MEIQSSVIINKLLLFVCISGNETKCASVNLITVCVVFKPKENLTWPATCLWTRNTYSPTISVLVSFTSTTNPRDLRLHVPMIKHLAQGNKCHERNSNPHCWSCIYENMFTANFQKVFLLSAVQVTKLWITLLPCVMPWSACRNS